MKNVEYLRNNYYGNINIRNDQKITIKPIFANTEEYMRKMHPRVREEGSKYERQFRPNRYNANVYLFDIFNKFAWLNDKIQTLKKEFDNILGNERK